MNILIPTLGTRGDVQPYIALAQGLTRAGHTVTLATHPCMGDLIGEHGINFAPIGPDVDIGAEAAHIRGQARHWIFGLMRTMQFTLHILEEAHEEMLALAHQSDMIVTSHSAAGTLEADQLRLPSVSVSLFTQAIPARDPHASLFNRAIASIGGGIMGTMMTRPFNQMRKRLRIPPMGRTGITSPLLNLIAISPLVEAPNPLWEAQHRVTGYWFADEPQGWQPDPRLIEFLEASEFPVVVSLGAMSLGESRAVADLVIEAVRRAGVQAIVQGWGEYLAPTSLSVDLCAAGSVPHSWLLPRVRAIVHHGGFGTTSAALRAGLPAAIIPHILDQFYWGNKVHTLNCGTPPIPRAKLTVKNLAAALVELRENPIFQQHAHQLGERIRAERGVETAVHFIEAAVIHEKVAS